MVALPCPTPDPVAPLRLPGGRTKTGYLGVYRKSNNRYAACFKFGGVLYRLGTYPTPRAAAERVAAEYRRLYGDRWPVLVRSRRANPWLVCRDRQLGGWVVWVWEWGAAKQLGDHLDPTDPRADWPRRRAPRVFPDRASAAAYLRWWRRDALPRRWGVLAPFALGR